jgi:hypothetical protein
MAIASHFRTAPVYARGLTPRPEQQTPLGTGLHRLLPRENLAASVYGTVLVSSVIVGLGGSSAPAGWMMAALGVTVIVFASAHAWALALARSADERRPMSVQGFLLGLRHEWPMAEAVLPALLALGLAVLDVYPKKTGLWIAIIANTVLLFIWGAILRHRAGGSAIQALTAGFMTSTLGLALVGLKVLVH